MNLAEQPWTILIVGLVLVFAAGLLAIQSGRSKWFAVSGLALLLTLGLAWWERQTLTPKEQITATLNQIAAALEKNDVDGVVEFVSAGKPELRAEARQKMSLVAITEVKIKNNLKIELGEDRGTPVANADFNAVIRFRGKAGTVTEGFGDRRIPQFFTLNFRQEDDGKWRIRDYRVQDPREGI